MDQQRLDIHLYVSIRLGSLKKVLVYKCRAK